jgi:lysophospholipase L1-like esterase
MDLTEMTESEHQRKSDVAFDSPQIEPPPGRRRLWQILTLGQCALCFVLLWQWLCVSTYRLYLDERQPPGASTHASARQRFEGHGDRVEPQILTTEDEHLSFAVKFPWPSQLRVRAVPNGQAAIEIVIVEHDVRRTLFRSTLSESTEIIQPLPPTDGVVELSNRGDVRWLDPRVVHDANVGPWLLGLMMLTMLTGWRTGRVRLRVPPEVSRARTVLLGGITAAVTAVLCLAILEVGLRAFGDRLPSWFAVQRGDLGEFRGDPRWLGSQRYGARLAPQLHTFCEWQHGDIVRMGFLPPELVRHPAYRFPFITDRNGFRNSATDSSAPAIAALGDSFTDAMTLPAELGWPARLAAHLGVNVRNYGTAGFGPGQEVLVLKEYVQTPGPRRVVVGFFAGNDLQDAENFAASGKEGAFSPILVQGREFKEVIARFDEFYVVSLYKGVTALLQDRDQSRADEGASQVDFNGEDVSAPAATRPTFDHGLFTVPVAGRTLRFAFLPPYLDRLKLSHEQLRASRGWEVTRSMYQEMNRLVRAQGGQLVVAFIPSKAQVYLPLLSVAFSPDDLQQALCFCLRASYSAPRLDVLMRNRLALNDLMRDFCAEEGIAFLDLTTVLQTKLGTGYNTYFPDDSHWNAAGHEVAADAIAGFMRERGL